jgi:hypothetical protein
MKKLALTLATLGLLAAPVFACPNMDEKKAEETPAAPRTADNNKKEEAPKAAPKAEKAKEQPKTDTAKKAPEKKADKVSQR